MMRSHNSQNHMDHFYRLSNQRDINNMVFNSPPEIPMIYPSQSMLASPNLNQAPQIIPYVFANYPYPDFGNTCLNIQNILLPNTFNMAMPERNKQSFPIDYQIPIQTKTKIDHSKILTQKEEEQIKDSKAKKIEIKVYSFWNSSDFMILKERDNKAEFSTQVYDKEIYQAFKINETKLKCKYCEFMAENRRSLGGHVSRHHPNISQNYKKIILRRNTKERIRSRTKLLLAKIEYFKRVKNLDYFADNIAEKWKTKYQAMINKNIFRKIRDNITDEMITNYLERKELKIKNN